jgi:hypothetical protein
MHAFHQERRFNLTKLRLAAVAAATNTQKLKQDGMNKGSRSFLLTALQRMRKTSVV